jgi:putative outer membrane protein
MSNLFSKVALGLSLTCALAMAEGAFVGFEGDYSFSSKLKVKNNNDSGQSIKKTQSGLGIKVGYDFDIARVYGAYVYDFQAKKPAIDDEGTPFTVKWNTHKFLIGTDYTPTVAQDFKLILGGYTGYSRLKIKAVLPNETEKGSSKGWILGAKIGGEYSFDANNAIEFGLKADRTDYAKISKFELKDIKETNVGLYLGYTYKF